MFKLKIPVLLFSLLFSFLFFEKKLNAQTPDQTIFIDFGPNNVVDGLSTNGTDVNGNKWTNFTNPLVNGSSTELINSNNEATSYQIGMTEEMSRKGIQDGGLLTPDAALLDEFAIATATQDFFFTASSGTVTFTNMDSNNGYRFSLLGSQSSAEEQRTKYTFTGFNIVEGILQTSGTDLGGSGINGNVDSVLVTDLVFPNSDGNILLQVSLELGSEAHLNALKIEEFIDAEPCAALDDYKISVMGSSVAKGQGATDFEGYAFQYGELLEERFTNNLGQEWEVSNISIGGNSTSNVLNRWDSDLVPECSRYVIYGLSLANEGIQNGGQTVFNQFNNNMQTLVDLAINREMTPVIMNTYPRASFESEQHEFLKDMNLLIHEWDVPSVNLLGALDNGGGKWASGFQADAGHPNNAGHTEFFYAMVPSLFDAIDAGKPQPVKTDGTFLTMGNSVTTDHLVFSPENIVHPFTISYDIKTAATGNMLAIVEEGGGVSILRISSEGFLKYQTASGDEIIGNEIINDDTWRKVSLTHYYARGETLLYLDSTLVGTFDEKIVPQTFYLNYTNSMSSVDYRDYFFYRSGMNEKEIAAMVQGRMLKSSLELYAPLDGQAVLGNDPLVNLAQSTNVLTTELAQSLSVANLEESNLFDIYPNPVIDTLFIKNIESKNINELVLRDVTGKLINRFSNTTQIDFSKYETGTYFLQIQFDDNEFANFKLIKN